MADDDVSRYFDIVPAPFVQAVGRVVTYWAWSEALLDQYIWRLLGVRPRRGRIVTSNLMARVKIETLAALLRKSKFDEKFVDELEAEGRALADFRNRVAHGYIAVGVGETTGVVISYLARGELKERSRSITAALLNKLADRIDAYMTFLIDGSKRLPKQRGSQLGQDRASPTPRRLRIGTTLRHRPPLLEVERQTTEAAQTVAKTAKRARREADRQRDLAKKSNGP